MNKFLTKTISYLTILVFLLVFGLSLISSYFIIFSKYSPYDDEGFLVISTKTFLMGNPLYDATFTQYGPFYYLVQEILYGLINIPLDQNHTRLTTIALWLISSFSITLYIYLTTKKYSLAFLTYIVAWNHLQVLTNEPSHPQEIAITLVSLIPLIALDKNENRRNILLAITATALLFTKINLGIFLFVGIFLSIYSLPTENKFLAWSKTIFYIAIFFMPIMLMRQKLNQESVQTFCSIITIGIVPILHYSYSNLIKWSNKTLLIHIIYLMVFTLLTSFLILSYVVINSTSLKAIFDFVILQPLKFPDKFSALLNIEYNATFISILGLGLYFYYIKKLKLQDFPKVIVYTKLLLAISLFTWSFFVEENLRISIDKILSYCPAFLWLTLIEDKNKKSNISTFFPRVILVTVAYLQILMTFPVAGTQKTLATFILVPMIAINLFDILPIIKNDFLTLWPQKIFRVATLFFLVYISFSFIAELSTITFPWKKYYSGVSLNFVGAERIRLAEEQTATYQWLIRNLNENCDKFISYPDFPSFYLWSQKNPASTITQNCWPAFLDNNQQEQIVDKLNTYNRVCAIKNSYWANFWLRGKSDKNLALANYINNEFKVLGQVGNYQFCVKKDQNKELTFTAKLEQKNRSSDNEQQKLVIALNINKIEQAVYNFVLINPAKNKIIFDTRKDSVLLEIQNQKIAFPNKEFLGLSLRETTKFRLEKNLVAPFYNYDILVVRLLDKEGQIIALVPVEKL